MPEKKTGSQFSVFFFDHEVNILINMGEYLLYFGRLNQMRQAISYMKINGSSAYALKKKLLRDKINKRCKTGKSAPVLGIIYTPENERSMQESQSLSAILSDCEKIGIRTFQISAQNATKSILRDLSKKCDSIYIQDGAYNFLLNALDSLLQAVDPKKNVNPKDDPIFSEVVLDILFRAHSGNGLNGLHALLIDDENRFAVPLSHHLRIHSINVTIGSSDMRNFKGFLKASDIIVTSAYHKNLITLDNIHPNSIIIDISGDCAPAINTIKSVGVANFSDGFDPIYRSLLLAKVVSNWSKHRQKKEDSTE